MVWDMLNQDHIESDCRRISFPAMPDLIPYAFLPVIRSQYRQAVFIGHRGLPEEDLGPNIGFLGAFRQ
jgi:hypothetical protein